jgi:hypothetical protein
MTSDNPPVFRGSDAWLLCSVAIGGGRRGASLRDIIAAGDYINHAILTGPQIRRGFAKLISAGLVRETAGRFRIAGKANAFWKKSQLKRKPVLRQLDDWETFLGVASPPEPDPLREDAERPYPAVSDAAVKRAYDEYVSGFG